jgi:cellulose synthase/poly-beta-1,6-N-acetylglucosamine synthase-like glycosyltransferase
MVNPEVIGSNYKVSTLHHLLRQAKYDILVITDSDVTVEPEYLHKIIPSLVAPQTDPSVGLVTCPIRVASASPFPALLESLLINTGFASMILVASQVEKTMYAFGATMAVKREALEEDRRVWRWRIISRMTITSEPRVHAGYTCVWSLCRGNAPRCIRVEGPLSSPTAGRAHTHVSSEG